MYMLNLKENERSWSLTSDKFSRFHSARERFVRDSQWWGVNRRDAICNEPFCIRVHAQLSPLESLWPVLSNVARKESLFFNSIQDSRWLAACRSRKDSPLSSPTCSTLLLLRSRVSSFLFALHDAARTRVHRRAHTHTRVWAMYFLSYSLMSIFATFDIALCRNADFFYSR